MTILSTLLSGQYTAGGWQLTLCKTGGSQVCAIPTANSYVLMLTEPGSGIAIACQPGLTGTITYECFADLTTPPAQGAAQNELSFSATVTNTLLATITLDTVRVIPCASPPL